MEGPQKVVVDHKLIVERQVARVLGSPRRDSRLLICWVEDSTGGEGVSGAGVGHAFTWVVCSCRSHKTQNRH